MCRFALILSQIVKVMEFDKEVIFTAQREQHSMQCLMGEEKEILLPDIHVFAA